jgi:hypothetical protein
MVRQAIALEESSNALRNVPIVPCPKNMNFKCSFAYINVIKENNSAN